MKKTVIFFFLLGCTGAMFAQGLGGGTLSGDLMMNMNFFQRDTAIKAAGNPLYDNYLSGSEGWLDLRYNVSGYTFTLRADAFNNSNLKNPNSAMTDFGIGAWSISKTYQGLGITVGSIYDAIGSGLLFRSYEDRGLLIDNALVGIELKYKLAKNIQIKGFSGQQKNNNYVDVDQAPGRYGPIIKGFNAEGDFSSGKAHFIPGVGVLNRTLDANSMTGVVATIDGQPLATRFIPMYNMYAFCGYNTFTYKNFSWYAEGDYKTHEAILNPFTNLLIDKPGDVEYTTINYGAKGIALNLSGKRTNDFVMQTSPNETGLNGMLNYQPVIADLRPERLLARYTPASEPFSEMAGTANLLLSPNDVTNINLSYTHINTIANQDLYRELYGELNYQGFKSWIIQVGLQYMEYNIVVYQNASSHVSAPIIYAVTPFTELTYRFNEKKSIRAELQYMDTKQDYGSWAFALVEYDVAPKYSIGASDMYNIVINKNADNPNYSDANFATEKAHNYYNLYVAGTKGPHRLYLAYVKQVDGINCSGGVCRYEPAFSGVKATLTTSF